MAEKEMEHDKLEVMCKICDKSIYRIFVEHIEEHLREMEEERVVR